MIKKLMPPSQRARAKAAYKGSLKALGRSFSVLINRLPVVSKIACKSGINIYKPMDYTQEILIHVSSDIENEGRAIPCAKEPETVRWIETYMKKGDILFDIGANVGAFSLIAAKYHNGGVRVFAFEPSFFNFSQLCRNVLLNKCEGAVTPFQIALSDKTQIAHFNYRDLEPGGASNAFGDAVSYGDRAFDPVLSQSVIGFTLDDFIAQFGLPVPTHVKLDVDGIELSILKGGPKTFRQVKTVLIEIDEERFKETSQFLVDFGFKLDFKELRASNISNCIFRK